MSVVFARHALHRHIAILHNAFAKHRTAAPFGTTCRANLAAGRKPLPPRPTIEEKDLEEKFIHGSGPGGQKINKTASAVQLHHVPSGLQVKCQDTRSREQNRKIARRRLAEKLELIEKGSESRTALKSEIKKKKRASKLKKTRRKYRKLEEEKEKSGAGAAAELLDLEDDQDYSGEEEEEEDDDDGDDGRRGGGQPKTS